MNRSVIGGIRTAREGPRERQKISQVRGGPRHGERPGEGDLYS